MPTSKIASMLVTQLTPLNGVFLLLIGFCSLHFNYLDATQKSHQRAALVARIGGWFYVIAGLAVIATTFL